MIFETLRGTAHVHTTLVEALWTPSRYHQAALILLGSLLIAISAQIQVPFWPVPMTMQSFMVLMIGATYGWRLGGATIAAYLIEGAVGLPVFAGLAGGAQHLVGPTAGYLAGFVIGAMVSGYLTGLGLGRTVMSALGVFLAGVLAIFALGLAWLSVQFGIEKAIAVGLMPFIFSEPTKIALATVLLPSCWKLVSR
jgi:biotin transport system substrate-specific component